MLEKQPLRLLKNMRKYHKSLRKNPAHRAYAHAINAAIKRKQEMYFTQQAIVAKTRLEKFLTAAIGSR